MGFKYIIGTDTKRKRSKNNKKILEEGNWRKEVRRLNVKKSGGLLRNFFDKEGSSRKRKNLRK